MAEEFIKLKLSTPFINTFFVVIQFRSILAVIVLFFSKLNPFDSSKTRKARQETINLWLKIVVATVPAGIVGFLFDEIIGEL